VGRLQRVRQVHGRSGRRVQSQALPGDGEVSSHLQAGCHEGPPEGGAADVRAAVEALVDSYRAGGKLIVCGNGGSASDARKKAADIWALLERRGNAGAAMDPSAGLNASASAGYDPLTVRFALWNLCRYDMVGEAAELFDLWCVSRYAAETAGSVTASEGKNEQVVPKERIVPFKEEWEYDIGSYIAFKQGRYARAEDILTAAMNNKNIKPGESARLNLALLYNGSSRRVQALALYRKILEDDRIDKKLQAEIYYKIAVIQREQKENRSAVLSLNQALALDPAHSRSRFMLKQLDSAAD